MKARLKILLTFCLLITLSGCSTTMENKESEQNTDKLIDEEPETIVSKESIEVSALNKEITLNTERNVLQDPPEYVAKNKGGLSIQDSETAYEMCARVLTDYYKAVWNGSNIEMGAFIGNVNLEQYTQKKIQYQFDLYLTHNLTDNLVKSVDVGTFEVEYTDDVAGGFLYLKLPVEIKKTVGSYGEPTEFLVRNVNGKLVIVDWYTGTKDSYDFMVRGENLTIGNPNIWDDSEWAKKVDLKQIEFSSSIQ
ncbi:hypothetical protein [Psychrobacillus sp. NPDC096623]|uniref:hypothetical protein n=1 Tax=Psychrobacillus sp. NPDC096623 TaxID=3364492 RepID=UPI00380A0254